MTEKLCLKWNDFQETVNTAFGSLRDDTEFADVTLACEDGQQLEAHKVILAASSPFFLNILKKNKHPHPLIYKKGTKFENLLAAIDFLYYGEANVFQENLESFLSMAEELKLKGLTGQQDVSEDNTEAYKKEMTTNLTSKREKWISNKRRNNFASQNELAIIESHQEKAVQNFVSGDLQELDEKVKSKMENSLNLTPNGRERAKICKVCRKEGYNVGIRDHIEANHLQGVSLPCNICEKTFRSRQRFRKHKCL